MAGMRTGLIAVVAAAAALAGCAATSASRTAATDPLAAAYRQALTDESEPALDRLWAALVKAGRCDAAGDYCRVDGDLRLDRDGLREELDYRRRYFATVKSSSEAQKKGKELSILVYRGYRDFWPRDLRNLIYRIDEASFATSNGAPRFAVNIVRAAAAAAAKDWNEACAMSDCGVTIAEAAAGDGDPVFTVRFANSSEFVALAFFPHEALTCDRNRVPVLDPARKDRAILWIYRGFFAPPNSNVPAGYAARAAVPDIIDESGAVRFKGGTIDISQAGVLRHELGHVLGYRHEFMSDAAFATDGFYSCRSFRDGEIAAQRSWEETELLSDGTTPVGDPFSVMMYPCSRFLHEAVDGDRLRFQRFDMALSDQDELMHRAVYTSNDSNRCGAP